MSQRTRQQIRRPDKIHRNTLDELKRRQKERAKEMPAVAEIIEGPEELRAKRDAESLLAKSQPAEPAEPAPQGKKDFCVGTVFINDSPEQLKWFDLQMRYLKATTSRTFDHVTFCAAPLKTKTFQEKSVLLTKKAIINARQSSAHVGGLTVLLDYFKKHQSMYDNFLFLDSDAFPIRKGWYATLTARMKRYEIAACLRPENLEQRLHASVLFAKRAALEHLKFQLKKTNLKDLVGHQENDVQVSPYQHDRRASAFPLLRSNKVQHHPLLCGVYYDMFYHNGCGSGRTFNMRARGYWNHMSSHEPDVQEMIDELMKHPNQFIKEIAGWSPELYPEV